MKCFFLDIDGTLLPFGKPAPRSAVISLKAAQALGCRIFIATGRSRAELPDLSFLDFDGFICSAGASVDVEGECIRDLHIPDADYARLSEYLSAHGLHTLVQTAEGTYMSQEARDLFYEYFMKYIGRIVALNGLIIGGVPSGAKVKKLLFLSPEGGWGVSRVKQDIEPGFTLVPNTVGLPYELMAEIVMAGVDKADGVKAVLDHYGLEREDGVAIGDGANDIGMITYAGTGIAMGNACNELKEAADFVTSDIEDDGIRNAIFHVLGGSCGGSKEEG